MGRIAMAKLDLDLLDEFTHHWFEGWNRHDGQAVAQLCTDDIVFTDPGTGTVRGRADVAGWVQTCARAFPDMRLEVPEPAYASRDRAKGLVLWRMSGTHKGLLDPPGFAPTHRTFVLEGVNHWEFRDGLVERYRADYDTVGFLRQLGLLPDPGSRLERVTVLIQQLGSRFRGKP
jgi:steroid delta-isomerase-like uncharacterized protein